MKNEELQNIMKIMGLQHNKDYSNLATLRYGRLMIMTDQVSVPASVVGRIGDRPLSAVGSRWFAHQRPPHQPP